MAWAVNEVLESFDRATRNLGADFSADLAPAREKLARLLRSSSLGPAELLGHFVEEDPNSLLLASLTLADCLPHDGKVWRSELIELLAGDLVTREDVDCTSRHLCVLGDLHTSGKIEVGGMDPLGSLAVAGSVRASSLFSDGVIVVRGDVSAKFIQLEHNDGTLRTLRVLDADLLIATHEHYFYASEESVRHSFDSDAMQEEAARGYPALTALLVDECQSAKGPDLQAIHRHCRANLPFLRDT